MPDAPLRDRARDFFLALQDEITTRIEQLDGGAVFRQDQWEYRPGEGPGLGGGRSRVIADGAVFEKGGVNVSAVEGQLTGRIAQKLGEDVCPFFATGTSLVLHPRSPRVPTVHMNVRYLELPDGDGGVRRSWFGGGADLTPYYLVEDDARHFHRCLREACDPHPVADYERFKQGCDEYFFVKHRGEARGIGGIFFDYLEQDPEATFAFVRDAGRAFLEAYVPIVERRQAESWGERERLWQEHRRGRYVEFNLVLDRGTLFGLETSGRIESILMSLPPVVRWTYDHRPEPGSAEAELLAVLRSPRSWV